MSRLVARSEWRLCGLLLTALVPAAGADQIKANNNSNLELGASWVSGVAPGNTDNAIWNSTVATASDCTNTLSVATGWDGIVIDSPAAAVSILSGTTLTNGANGINMSAATVDLTLNCATLTLAVNQTWTIASGRTLVTGSSSSGGRVQNSTVTIAGGGTWTTSGTDDNGSLGVVVVSKGLVNLNKSSTSGAHAVGGPGLTINNGGAAVITGSGGDQIYDGATVTLAAGGLFDLHGNNEGINSLSGSGGVVDNTAPGTIARLTNGATIGNNNSTFRGTIQNSGSGATLVLVKGGSGTLTLAGANTYSGSTIVNSGTLSLTTTNNVSMPYVINGGVLSVTAANASSALSMSHVSLGTGSPQLTFNLGGVPNLPGPIIAVSGAITLNGNVAVNVANIAQSGFYILLQYGGVRSGSGSFVAGSLPNGATLTDDTVNNRVTLNYVSALGPRVVIPTLNTNEIIVAITTPQQFGAKGDGVTDDSAAFQNAMNAVYNSGGSGGGVVFVPAANYAFYTNITIPTGVTLHGDWTDWTKTGGGLVGTTFEVHVGADETTNTPFITMNGSALLRGVNIWYPNQNPNNITAYPFTIGMDSDCVIKNVALVNSYQGIETYNGGGDRAILSTVVGTPLFMGVNVDDVYDICHAEDVRFSPDVWAMSGLANAPSPGGAYATWMRTNGTGLRLVRVDGDLCMDTFLSGYNIGILFTNTGNGDPGITFNTGAISNCAIGIMAQDMPTGLGLMFANFTIDSDTAIERTRTDTDANIQFDRCTIIGRNGPAANVTGADSSSWLQFQNCTISNALTLSGPGVVNVVDSTLLGATQCVMSATATRAAFTGCAFSPSRQIVNNGSAGNLLVDARTTIPTVFTNAYWTNILADYATRKAAKTNLFITTSYGSTGNGVTDDTSAIQSALNAAGTNGGGIVYLPAGLYHLSGTLDVPSGVELRGPFELRHWTGAASDGYVKGSVLRPYAGQGGTNGPPAIALESGSGLVGVTFSYETQNTNCIPFPPAIQGRGGNIYAIGVAAANPYLYVDLDSYACTNHFLYLVDGWAIKNGFNVGHGSSGSLVDCMANWTYWIDNGNSQSTLPQSIQAPVIEFVAHHMNMYTLGNCTELMVKDFSIIENTYLTAKSENGLGPNATLIGDYCDGTIRGIVLDAPAIVNSVNTPLCVFNFNNDGDLSASTVDVLATTNFQGEAHLFNTCMFAQPYWDANINGGEVTMELAHMNSSQNGSIVNGGTFHLINLSAATVGAAPPYNVAIGPNAGAVGTTNEFIGCFSLNGCSADNAATNSPFLAWNDYALSTYSTYNPNLPVLYGFSPGGNTIFQYTNALSFTAGSPAGITTNHVTVSLNHVAVTNLSFAGSPTSWTVTFPGLAINKAYTAIVSVRDNNGNIVSATNYFDTFASTNYTFEAEDFDYNGGHFIDNPQTDAYAGRAAINLEDCYNGSGGGEAYRPNPSGLETEGAGDVARAAYTGGLQDYDVGFNGNGNWGNYTRTYPAGVYYLYIRCASPNGSPSTTDAANLSLVTSGLGTTSQTTTRLGTFTIPNTGGWQVYTWAPLINTQGNPVQITNNGLSKTFRITTDNGGYNANFYELAPTTVAVSPVALGAVMAGGGVNFSFGTQIGFSYQLESAGSLTNPVWQPMGGLIYGNGAAQQISVAATGSSQFYRLQIQQVQ